MRTETGEVVWNLGLQEIDKNRLRLIMPDEYGRLEETETRYVISWPLNPHFTGKHGIAELLSRTPLLAGKLIEV